MYFYYKIAISTLYNISENNKIYKIFKESY